MDIINDQVITTVADKARRMWARRSADDALIAVLMQCDMECATSSFGCYNAVLHTNTKASFASLGFLRPTWEP
jgi:hypothetical protein